MAGQSQSPSGRRATTSTRPYLMLVLDLVLRRADLTGLTMVPLVVLVAERQSVKTCEEQMPWALRSTMLSFSMSLLSWSVGLRYRTPSWTYAFSSVFVVTSN